MQLSLPKLFAIAAHFLYRHWRLRRHNGSISLGWERNTEQDIVGYKVYLGTASGVYGQFDDVPRPRRRWRI